MIQSFKENGIALLLVTSIICVQCTTNEAVQTNEQHFPDDSAHNEGINQKSREVVDNSEKNKATCDEKEECDDLSAGSSSVIKKTASVANPNLDESKPPESVEKSEVGQEVPEDEKRIEDDKGISENELADEESSNEQKIGGGISHKSAMQGKKGSSEKTINENEIEINEITQDFKNESSFDKTISESNSTFYHWLKFLLDPIIEEFKDGIYPKISDKTNSTTSNVSLDYESTTIALEAENVTVAEPANITEAENVTDTSKKVKFQCTGKNVTDNVNATVKLITTAQLLQMLNFEKNDTENVTDCLLVMFYAPWCHFCAKIAPYYNALARAFPQLDFVAVDTAQFSNLLARFGTVSVPNILIFHQSRAAVKFNQTERTFENLVTFVTNSTGLESNNTVNVTDADYLGPVPSVPTNEPDYLLLISWIFVIFCSTCMFVKSNKGQQWINRVRILWQEHQHID